MESFYKRIIRPFLFRIDAENAHKIGIIALRFAGHQSLRQIITKHTHVPYLSTRVFGIEFPNPVGIAAGFDKNGVALQGLATLGFGFITIGTITPLPQPGNPRPRVFRLVEDHGIINRYGFNSQGAVAVAENLKKCGKIGVPIFISIGKNKNTPNENAVDDYMKCIDFLHPYADAFECCVSSPNTPGIRDLQQREPLFQLCFALQSRLAKIADITGNKKKPLLLKVAPDLTNQQFDDILDVVSACKIEGLIVCNTTLARPDSLQSTHKQETGGLSGTHHVFERMLFLVRYAHKKYPDLPIIAVGGIKNSENAQQALNAGASLVQILTGMIYSGPFIARDINRGIRKQRFEEI